MIEKEFKWYLENQSQLIEKYNGKFLIIQNNSIIGDYDTEEDAVFDAQKKYEQGTYIIQFCSPGDDAYTQHFHSRVVFV
jgi:hypothetical protein